MVVADTSPLRYLILIAHDHLLPALFGQVHVPTGVLAELAHPSAPAAVRAWATAAPTWITVHAAVPPVGEAGLGRGEAEALGLALATRPSLLLVDDRAARMAARRYGLAIAGTLAVLTLAADEGLVQLADAVTRLRHTNFRADEALLRRVLNRDADP